jgi:hypothetical protein
MLVPVLDNGKTLIEPEPPGRIRDAVLRAVKDLGL